MNYNASQEETENLIRNKRLTQLCSAVNATYDDVELLARYQKRRDNYAISKGELKNERQHYFETPNFAVHKFLELIFKPIYGNKWATKREVLTHDYVRPWLLIPLNKIMTMKT